MRNYGTAGSTRTYERELVASEYPSIQVYRRPITLYETQKAKAGKFFYGNPNSTSVLTGANVLYGLLAIIALSMVGEAISQGDR